DFADGTFFVPLAPITDPDLVPSTIAHTLGVQVGGSEMPLTRDVDHVRGKRLLLVLDNFEQILPAAPIVGEILGASPVLKVITSQSMLPKLRRGLDMLASTARDLPAGHRTLNGAIAWSWDLLNESEKRLFARLAAFVAGPMLPEIDAVSGDGEVLDVLSALVEQSLVRQSEVEGEPRFRMLVTIREYALVRLAESGEADEISRRHAAAYLALAEEA